MELPQLYEAYLSSSGICTDTRQIKSDCIFFALKGERFDANTFAAQALTEGAKLAVIDNPDYTIDGKTILVENTLASLQELAKFHRNKLKIPIIGLTGSNGKTTTKELIHAVLTKKYNAFATHGNLNNHIGVPLSILSIDSNHEIAVIEMGANHVGEISFLCSMSQPTHGLITNIGKAHIGEFGGFENIIRSKSELYHFLIKSNGQVFINSKQEILFNMAKRFSNPLFYPSKGDYYHCKLTGNRPYLQLETETGKPVNSQLVGKYNFDNITAALCLAQYFDVDEDEAISAIEEYAPKNNRSQIIKSKENTIILDAYNANPSSMEAAIENLVSMKGSRKMVILGDMLELGEEAEKEHRAIGKLLSRFDLENVLLTGELMKYTAEEISGAKHFKTKDDLLEHLKNHSYTNKLILIKGSRSMGLEKTVEHL